MLIYSMSRFNMSFLFPLFHPYIHYKYLDVGGLARVSSLAGLISSWEPPSSSERRWIGCAMQRTRVHWDATFLPAPRAACGWGLGGDGVNSRVEAFANAKIGLRSRWRITSLNVVLCETSARSTETVVGGILMRSLVKWLPAVASLATERRACLASLKGKC